MYPTITDSGLQQIRDGKFTSPDAIVALDYLAYMFGQPANAQTDSVLEAVAAAPITWSNFEREIVNIIRDPKLQFGWPCVEALACVRALNAKYPTLHAAILVASKFEESSLDAIRKIFYAADTKDRYAFVAYLRAQVALQTRNSSDLMMMSHCDKYPAYQWLADEFAGTL